MEKVSYCTFWTQAAVPDKLFINFLLPKQCSGIQYPLLIFILTFHKELSNYANSKIEPGNLPQDLNASGPHLEMPHRKNTANGRKIQ
jgi:hypothetical protein